MKDIVCDFMCDNKQFVFVALLTSRIGNIIIKLNKGELQGKEKDMCNLTAIDINNKKVMVADIKKDFILNIINSVRHCNAINKVVLFGSSTGNNCSEQSDIDIAVFGDKTRSKMLSSKDYRAFVDAVCGFELAQDYDILYFGSEKMQTPSIMKDISRGVVLYERG